MTDITSHKAPAATVELVADELWDAGKRGVPIAAVRDRITDIDSAYATQVHNISRAVAQGDQVVGHKVGLSSRAMQQRVGVDEPDFGTLLTSMVFDDHSRLPIAQFIQPRVEIETAFVLSRPLSGEYITLAEVASAIECVLPCIEIVDSRIEGWDIGITDTVADNASCGAVVVGGRPSKLADLDLRLQGAVLSVNGEIAETGAGGAVLGNPLNAVAWLARTLSKQGSRLEAGELILPGSCTAMVPVAAGDHVAAEFSQLGRVGVSFHEQESG